MKNSSTVIKIENLIKKVKGPNGQLNLIDDTSLEIKDGEKVAFVGGNGAGKTTLVETILGIQTKTSGKVIWNFDYKKSPLEKVGVQFQDSNFPEGLSGRDIIKFFLDKSISPDHKIVEKLISDFKMENFIDRDSSKFSGGQAQKLNVILALVNKPKILFLDELTTGLDVFAKNMITQTIEDYVKKTNSTMLLVSHSSHEIERLAERVIVIKAGKVTNDMTVKDIIKKHKNVGHFLDMLL